jgi:hypothetical protein
VHHRAAEVIDDTDDTIDQYVPGKPKGARAKLTTTAGDGGIVVTASVTHGAARPLETDGGREPTRYALALRRQASNRARKAAGQPVLPQIGPGSCVRCEGWGVLGQSRQRCPGCGGRGDA